MNSRKQETGCSTQEQSVKLYWIHNSELIGWGRAEEGPWSPEAAESQGKSEATYQETRSTLFVFQNLAELTIGRTDPNGTTTGP